MESLEGLGCQDDGRNDDRRKEDGYDCLRNVYAAAVEQACGGKGRERHASGEPFTEQTIMQTTRSHGIGFATGQAEKKGRESHRLVDLRGVGAAKAELLGAMNYLAAAYLRLDEMEEDEVAVDCVAMDVSDFKINLLANQKTIVDIVTRSAARHGEKVSAW